MNKFKKLASSIPFLLLVIVSTSCSDIFSSEPVEVKVILYNELLWNIGHDYSVSGTDSQGESFESDSKYIQYLDVLIEGKSIEKGSKITILRDGSEIWTSEAIDESCTIHYTNSAYDDEVVID